MKENKDFFEINPFILRPLMCTSKKEKIKILQNIYVFLKIIKKRLSCMSIYGFQAKLSYHGHISDIVYYNVSKLCTYVHIAISKHFCQLEFFYFYVFFSNFEVPKCFFCKSRWKIYGVKWQHSRFHTKWTIFGSHSQLSEIFKISSYFGTFK
jgi:hypothetical protein